MADTWLSAARVIGSVCVTGGGDVGRLSAARVIGPVSLSGTAPAPGGRLSIARVIGRVAGLGAGSDEARLSVARVIGHVRLRASNGADPWTAAGFPVPRTGGYQLTHGHALVRTAMESGATRQRARWLTGYHQCTATFTLASTQLADLEAFLEAVDYAWFGMPVAVLDTCDLRRVRVIDNPRFSAAGPALIEVWLKLEIAP
jgi:hypothetical protein